MEKEIWKDIKGYEGLYQVSQMGNVRALNFYKRKGVVKNLKLIKASIGYLTVSLHKKGSQSQFFVHRLVADAFVYKPYGEVVVDHINTDQTDNRADNLRWVSICENVNNPISKQKRTDSIRRRFKGKLGVESASYKACVQKNLNGEVIRVWSCMSDAVRQLGLDSGCLTRVCQGKRLTHGGYKWEYYEI